MSVIEISTAKSHVSSQNIAALREALVSEMIDLSLDESAIGIERYERLKNRDELLARQQRTAQKREKTAVNKHGDEDRDFAAEIEQWVIDHQLHFNAVQNLFWYRHTVGGGWQAIKSEALRRVAPHANKSAGMEVIDELIKIDNRTVTTVTYSFRKQPSDTLNLMRTSFVPMVAGEHHFIFDILMESLSGGNAQAREHLEKVILTKYLHPDNPRLPALVFADDDGGSGKGILCERVFPTIFGTNSVIKSISMEYVTGKYNSLLGGKIVTHINETEGETTNHKALWRLLGSKNIPIGLKHVGTYEVDNTALYIISGNDILRTATVTGKDQDRRLSFLMPDFPLGLRVISYLDEAEGRGGVDFARAKIDKEYRRAETARGSALLINKMDRFFSDPTYVGRWLNHLHEKYGDIEHVAAYHSTEYQQTLESQKKTHERMFESLFKDVEFTHIRQALLVEMYNHFANRDGGKIGRIRFLSEAKAWLAVNAPEIKPYDTNWQLNGKKRCKISVFSKTPQPANNDRDYVLLDKINGSKFWKWDF